MSATTKKRLNGIEKLLLAFANGIVNTLEMLVYHAAGAKPPRRSYRKSLVQHSTYRGSRWTRYPQKPIVIVIERERP